MSDRKPNTQERSYLIDFARGLLVFWMVVYHALNYTVSDSAIFNYLRFIAPGFVGLSGFVIAKVLRKKYASRELVLYQRLVARGLKLIGLFTLLNILIILVLGSDFGRGLAGLREFSRNIGAIYLAGMEKEPAFGVLVPIGYLLIL
jgi:peptidoglycan/LPS O-acetylase OafA/YrhL